MTLHMGLAWSVMVGAAFLPSEGPAQVREAEAIAGTPFGVGWIRVLTPTGQLPQPSDTTYHVEAADGRVFYPAFFREGVPGSADPREVYARGAFFLFKGDGPLKVRF